MSLLIRNYIEVWNIIFNPQHIKLTNAMKDYNYTNTFPNMQNPGETTIHKLVPRSSTRNKEFIKPSFMIRTSKKIIAYYNICS